MIDDPEFQRFADGVLKDLVPMIDKSAYCVSIVPRKPESYTDVKWCIELGMMIMLDKPIIAIVQPGTKVPEKLVLVADAIIEMNLDGRPDPEHLSVEIKAAMARLDAKKQAAGS